MGQHARVENVVNDPRTGGGDHVRLAIGGHGKNVTMRLAAKYCDEINIDLPADALPEAIAVLADRCDEIGRDPATLDIVTGTNPAWPYPGLRAIGRQRLMTKEDLPAIMPLRLRQPAAARRRDGASGSSSASTASSAACPGWSTPTRASTS